jgi:acyl-CoA synthetase (AMP-forming)/AMP-acid ligase II
MIACTTKDTAIPAAGTAGLLTACGFVIAAANSLSSSGVDTSAMILDFDGNEVTDKHCEGRLFIKGPSMMSRYKNLPELMENQFSTAGYFDTGDFVRLNDGVITIIARATDMIRFKGNVISPTEIEDTLSEHPEVADVAVFGVIGEGGYPENARACVVLKNTETAPAAVVEDLQSYIMSRVGSINLPIRESRTERSVDS